MSLRAWWGKLAAMSGVQVFGILTGVISVVVTARWLGAEGRGIIAAVTAWTTLFTTFGHFSLGQVAIYRATQQRGTDWLPSTFGTLIGLTLSITLVGWIVAAVMYWGPWGNLFGSLSGPLLLIGFVGLPFLLWDQHGGALLMAANEVRAYNISQFVGRTLALVLVLLAWVLKANIVWVVGATVLGTAIGRFVGMRQLWERAGRSLLMSATVARQLLGDGAKLHLNYIGDFFIAQVNVLLLDRMLGHPAAGQYQIAEYVITMLMVVPQAAAMLLYGHVSAEGPDEAWRHQRRIVLTLAGAMALLAGVAALLAPIAMPLAFGHDFRPAVPLLQVLLLTVVPMTLVKGMMSQWIGRGLFATMSVVTLVLGAVNVAAMYFFVPRYGLVGAGWAAICVYGLVLLVQLTMVAHVERRSRAPAEA